jgi:hypothetical protein
VVDDHFEVVLVGFLKVIKSEDVNDTNKVNNFSIPFENNSVRNEKYKRIEIPLLWSLFAAKDPLKRERNEQQCKEQDSPHGNPEK